jgi:guanine nucleotide-binding protein alpha-1 subunit
MTGAIDRNDPFSVFHTPPPNETAEGRALRERQELKAQRVSDQIDEELKAEKAISKKQQKGLVKVLFLGQSESGKSTALKSKRLISHSPSPNNYNLPAI